MSSELQPRKRWVNGNNPDDITASVLWLENSQVIVLKLEDKVKVAKITFPQSARGKADRLFKMFSMYAPQAGDRTPCVNDIVSMASDPGGPLAKQEKPSGDQAQDLPAE